MLRLERSRPAVKRRIVDCMLMCLKMAAGKMLWGMMRGQKGKASGTSVEGVCSRAISSKF